MIIQIITIAIGFFMALVTYGLIRDKIPVLASLIRNKYLTWRTKRKNIKRRKLQLERTKNSLDIETLHRKLLKQ